MIDECLIRIVEVSLANTDDYKALKTSNDISLQVLTEFAYPADFHLIKFLKEQGDMSLREYLSIKNKEKEKVSLVEYVPNPFIDPLAD
ncbi:hypothetical protein [Paenibacillus paridis]|uniref:hypothetical protein n=1 Tax=Paenibacillus paridis TaxID=2583376 RepID=UPI001122688D|nr:hypothetical protein [Paenibacillus paridis]